MLDYIFFAPTLSNKFKDHLTKTAIIFECRNDENFGSVQGEIISISENINDAVLIELQNLYDELQEQMAQLLEQNDEGLLMNAAGMAVKLKNGTLCTLRVAPDIITRILTVLEFDELQTFVENIASSVEEPDSDHFCHNINKD